GDDRHLDGRRRRGELRVEYRHRDRGLALVQVGPIDGDRGALAPGALPRLAEARTGGRVRRREQRLVLRVELVPLEHHVVDAETVVRGENVLDRVEADADLPALGVRPRIEEEGV